MLSSFFDWLQEQFDDSAKRERLFKVVAVISQAMLLLGVILLILMFQEDLRSVLGLSLIHISEHTRQAKWSIPSWG